ncbi:MAG: IPTL-CTERM sorting domain-containing protein [Gammaproteobacteria bacterium]|nr:IPTL-CTERM sorting domain-containing protein [Gammaproteobacteria bacterium]
MRRRGSHPRRGLRNLGFLSGLLVAGPAIGNAATMTSSIWQGFQFTTGSQSASLQSIDLAFFFAGTTSMTWYLYADGGSGVPANGATALATYTAPSATYAAYSDGNAGTLSPITFGGTLTSYQLAPNTSYVLILKIATSGINVAITNSSISSTQGWTNTTQRVFTTDAGSTWNPASLPFVFNLNTVSAPTPAAVPTLSEWAQLMLGLMVLTMLGWQWRKQRL